MFWDGRAIVYATTALVGGPIMFYRGFKTLRLRRLIADTPTARIRSMAMGLVEVNGTVEMRSTVNAPFSGRTCAYWEIDISTPVKNGWSIAQRDRSGNPFFLRDGDGVALVYPHDSQCTIPFGTDEVCSRFNLPPVYAEYIRAHPSLDVRCELNQLRFRERVLEVGERVFVFGTAMPRGREQVISDGVALQATGTDDAVAVQRAALDHEVVAVIRKGENESTFIISEGSERTMLTELGAKAILLLWGGPPIALFGLGLWLLMLSSGR